MMDFIMKFLLFSCWSFVALVPTVNATADEAPITITFKNPKDCPDAGEHTVKAFLEYYATCAFEQLGGIVTDDYDDGGGDRELQSCSNCNAYCNCRNNYSQNYCATRYPGCYFACNCNRRNLEDPFSEGDDVTEESFEEEVIARGSPTLRRKAYGMDLWQCACNQLRNRGIDGHFFRTNTSNMCNCINKNVDTWTNME